MSRFQFSVVAAFDINPIANEVYQHNCCLYAPSGSALHCISILPFHCFFSTMPKPDFTILVHWIMWQKVVQFKYLTEKYKYIVLDYMNAYFQRCLPPPPPNDVVGRAKPLLNRREEIVSKFQPCRAGGRRRWNGPSTSWRPLSWTRSQRNSGSCHHPANLILEIINPTGEIPRILGLIAKPYIVSWCYC